MERRITLWLAVVSSAGPGEVGRPKEISLFRAWGGEPTSSEFIDSFFQEDDNSPMRKKPLPPHFELTAFDLNGGQIQLKSLWAERPLLLVHSSLTCPHIDRIHEQFANKLEVVVIYTTEAHPVGSPSPYSEGGDKEWITDRNIAEDILVDDPTTLEAWLTRARNYRARQQIKAHMIADSMENGAWKYFGAEPNTGMLIDRDGKVVARHGWIQPTVMAGEIRKLLVRSERAEISKKLKEVDISVHFLDSDIDELRTAIATVPELVRYHQNTKGACNHESFLHGAIERGNLESAALLIKHGNPPDIKDGDGLTPLHYALRGRPWRDVKFELAIALMLKGGADIRARADDLRSSLHFAVAPGKPAHVNLALEAGAPLDAYSIDAISPLHDALFLNHEEIASMLIEHCAANEIYVAAALGDLEGVKRHLTVRADAWKKIQGNSGRSLLMYAAIGGQTECLNFLLSKQTAPEIYSRAQLHTSLSNTIEFNRTSAGLSLAEKVAPMTREEIADSNKSSLLRQSPVHLSCLEPLLHAAAAADEEKVVAKLIDRGWSVKSLDADEETALDCAAESGCLEAVKVLLQHRAAIDANSGHPRPQPCGPGSIQRENKTALHLAVISREVETVKFLIKKGSNVNMNDTKGRPPLLYVVPNGYRSREQNEQEFVKVEQLLHIFIAAGADPNTKGDGGRTLRSLASEMVSDYEIIDGSYPELADRIRSPELLELLDKLE
ncbi:MAG: ankyrin repeat protein [Verrucomicrobiales bacterium]|jgi:ankyrin repeat protein